MHSGFPDAIYGIASGMHLGITLCIRDASGNYIMHPGCIWELRDCIRELRYASGMHLGFTGLHLRITLCIRDAFENYVMHPGCIWDLRDASGMHLGITGLHLGIT